MDCQILVAAVNICVSAYRLKAAFTPETCSRIQVSRRSNLYPSTCRRMQVLSSVLLADTSGYN